jgi:hypothetical protein
MHLTPRNGCDALREVEDTVRLAILLTKNGLNDFDVSAFERPCLRRKLSRSSSERATICCRAAAMPPINGAGEELASSSMPVPPRGQSAARRTLNVGSCSARNSLRPTDRGSCRRRADRNWQCQTSCCRPHCSSSRSRGNRHPVSRRQPHRLNRVGIIDQRPEHVAVAGVERRRVLGHVHHGLWVMADRFSTPGTFHCVSQLPLPAICMTAATS